MTERFGLDTPKVTRDEALELMVYHLRMASTYFEATPEDIDGVRKEMTRIMLSDEAPGVAENNQLAPALAWLAVIHDYYEKLKDED